MRGPSVHAITVPGFNVEGTFVVDDEPTTFGRRPPGTVLIVVENERGEPVSHAIGRDECRMRIGTIR